MIDFDLSASAKLAVICINNPRVLLFSKPKLDLICLNLDFIVSFAHLELFFLPCMSLVFCLRINKPYTHVLTSFWHF